MGCSNSIQTLDQTHSSFVAGKNTPSNATISKFKGRYNVIKKISEGPVSKVFMVTKVLANTVEVHSEDDSDPEAGVLVMQVITLTAATPQIQNTVIEYIERMRKLRHPNILRIFDLNVEDDKSGFAMVTELCTGEDLESIVPCSEQKAQHIALQLIKALQYMHSMGHFGHDLSTENIMFSDEEKNEIKVSYAGLPILASGGATTGEMARKDIGEVGAIAYRLLTGKEMPNNETNLFGHDDDLSQAAKAFVLACTRGISGDFDVVTASKHDWFVNESTLSESKIEPVPNTESPEEEEDVSHDAKKEMPREDTDTTLETLDDSLVAGICASSGSDSSRSTFAPEDILAETSVLSSSSEASFCPPSTHKPRKRTVMSLSEKLEKSEETGSSSLSPSELQELRDVFLDLQSTKSDGEVTVKEVKEIFNRRMTGYTEEEVDSWFQGDKFDDSRNIKYTEFLDEAKRSRRKLEFHRPEDTFRQFDKGRRGFVTVGNLRALLGTASSNQEKLEQLIKEASSRKDGTITYERFEEVFTRLNITSEQ